MEYARLLFLTFSLSRNALCRGNKSIIFTIYTKDTSVKKRKRKKTKSYCITLDGLRLGKFRSLTHNYSTQRHRSDPRTFARERFYNFPSVLSPFVVFLFIFISFHVTFRFQRNFVFLFLFSRRKLTHTLYTRCKTEENRRVDRSKEVTCF